MKVCLGLWGMLENQLMTEEVFFIVAVCFRQDILVNAIKGRLLAYDANF